MEGSDHQTTKLCIYTVLSIERQWLQNECQKNIKLHTEVRWLSRGNMLVQLIELNSEVQIFLMETGFNLCNRFTYEYWLAKLAYLSDIFCRLNDLNLSLQGPTKTSFVVNDKIKAMIKKLHIMINVASKKIWNLFQIRNAFLLKMKLKFILNLSIALNATVKC